jgi:hypothetical protein
LNYQEASDICTQELQVFKESLPPDRSTTTTRNIPVFENVQSEPQKSEGESESQTAQPDRTFREQRPMTESESESEMMQLVKPKLGYSQFINKAKYDPFPERDDRIEDLDEETIKDVSTLRIMINYFRNRYYWNQKQLGKLEDCEPNVINHIDVDISDLPKDWGSSYVPITVQMRPAKTGSLEEGYIMAIEVALDEEAIKRKDRN